ncbi:MAG TPA: alpha/beta hydrolase-fold protein [Pirellulales bacterium]|jgi:S-formylglutathione hydrolase FrmB
MRTRSRLLCCQLLLAYYLGIFATAARAAEGVTFAVTLDRATAERQLPEQDGRRTVSGRLYVFLSQREVREPMRGPSWFQAEPFFGVDVQNVAPGDVLHVDARADGYPEALDKLPAGKYRAQAILDYDFYHQSQAKGVGNFYSAAREITVDSAETKDGADAKSAAATQTFDLTLDQVIAEEPVAESAWVKEISLRSELLSKFFGREVFERATLVLPAGYDEQLERRYPVVYEIPGFGGSHRPPAKYRETAPKTEQDETDFIRVYLSGDCKWGHHVYADSATNGPRGAALVHEMIPFIDSHFRTIPDSNARFVTGHSSGGWSSLWLQVNYPETFGGCWSTSPDPVDFRDYQQVNLYARPPLSLYYDPQGAMRPIGRRGNEPFLWYVNFGRMDDVIGRGGQLRSFEAVFSPLGPDGQPQKLWDRRTGQIDPAVAKAWEKYDIRLILERNWPALAPQLAGKLHIITGELDTFYLNGAVHKLAESLQALGSDAAVEIVQGKGHSDLRTPEVVRRIFREMTASFRQAHPGQ